MTESRANVNTGPDTKGTGVIIFPEDHARSHGFVHFFFFFFDLFCPEGFFAFASSF